MYITLTTSRGSPEELRLAGEFLVGFLPRLKQEPGVLAIYHFDRPDKGDDVTIIIWEDEEAVKAYRQGSLIKEAMAFEKVQNLPAAREGYTLTFAASDKI